LRVFENRVLREEETGWRELLNVELIISTQYHILLG
jgi:hypothetical protein